MGYSLKTKDRDVEGSDLAGIVGKELAGSRTFDLSQNVARRELTLRYIRGDMPDLPGRKNGSQQTDRTIADVISWILPGIMRTLTAGDEMVKYAPVKEESPEWSSQATAFTNWDFTYNNDGYRVLYAATHDSLATGNGLVRCYHEEEQTKTERWTGVSAEDVAEKLQDIEPGSIRILSQAAGEPRQEDAEDGVTQLVPTFDIKVERILSKGRICDQACKPENLRINSRATTLDSARFVGYLHDEFTRSDLIEMGFPRDKVDALQRYQGIDPLEREKEDATFRDSPTKSTEPVEVYECYLRADADGDGIAEMLQVWYGGSAGTGVVLGWDYWDDELPFTDIPCYPVPHRYEADSVADRTMDIQRVRTVLIRSLLDSTYASTTPQRAVKEGAILNPDALVNPRFGSNLWVKSSVPLADAIAPLTVPYVGDKSLVALQYMDEQTTKRTGISRTTMALDPEALTNQTATAARDMRDAGYSQIELIARNQAELGWSKYFAKRLKLAIKHKIVARVPMKARTQPAPTPAPAAPGQPPQQQAPRQQTEFRIINAEKWDENMAVSINTGLGTGSRDRDMAMLHTMMQTQTAMALQLSQTGLPTAKAKAIEFIPKILNSAVLLAESAGIKDPSGHFPEITDEDVAKMFAEGVKQAQQPNPEVLKEQVKAQTTLQVEQGKMQLDQQARATESQAQVIREKAQLEADLQTKQADRDNALIIEDKRQAFEREKLTAEMQFRMAELNQQRELKMLELSMQAQSMTSQGETPS